MKFLVVLAVAVACAHADVSHLVRSSSSEAQAPILRSDFDLTPEGNFQYAYETGNGIAAQADGVVKNLNSEYPALEQKGSVRYTSPEGVPVDLTYVANENGYQPQGAHLPVPPPIPEQIARALAYIAAHPPAQSQESSFSRRAPANAFSAFGKK